MRQAKDKAISQTGFGEDHSVTRPLKLPLLWDTGPSRMLAISFSDLKKGFRYSSMPPRMHTS